MQIPMPHQAVRFLRRLAAPCVALLVVLAVAAPTAKAQDLSELLVRLGQVENQMRLLSGQVEELQFENRQLREQLRRVQEDADFRFRELGGPASGVAPLEPAPERRGDAFDPTRDPTAPGAPQQLGATQPSTPLGEAELSLPGTGPLDIAAILRGEEPAPTLGPRGPSIAATGSDDPRADYEAAYALLLAHQYERAEMAFRQFIQSHPRDELVPDAVFWLGETYAQRGRHREAAEQFLRITTEFETARRAPEAMLKLGTSLVELGAREQACATFAEWLRKYDAAGSPVREEVARERRRAACA
ncbi:tol-pal system protein YbgF [Salinarimonas sp.]|uniref:tol-pal system protein YbgF n=1 Tax=Salinarimonas sp. TaxID=2766526 RepID=UPI00391C7D57